MYTDIQVQELKNQLSRFFDRPSLVVSEKSNVSEKTIRNFFLNKKVRPSLAIKIHDTAIEIVDEQERLASEKEAQRKAVKSASLN